MPAQDHYKTLQVTPDAEPEVIGAAYKLLAFKYHPDRNPGSACDGRMQELNDAYETLRDPQRRQQYDAQRNAAQAIPDVSQYVHSMLDRGLSPNEVVKNLITNGFDLETSARIVGTIVELRLSSAPTAGVPTTSPSNSSSSNFTVISSGFLFAACFSLIVWILWTHEKINTFSLLAALLVTKFVVWLWKEVIKWPP